MMANVPRTAIITCEDLFQWRDLPRNAEPIRRQYELLFHTLQSTRRPFDPLLVYPSPNEAGRFMVVDGHLRLKAYQRYGWRSEIPIMLCQGTLRQAKEAGLKAHLQKSRVRTRPKLPLDVRERVEAAWRLTKDDPEGGRPYTRREIIQLTAVSDQTIGRMRRTLEAHGDTVRDLRWSEILEVKRGIEPEADPEWKLQKAKVVLRALRQKSVLNYTRNPVVLAMAIKMMDDELPDALKATWSDQKE